MAHIHEPPPGGPPGEREGRASSLPEAGAARPQESLWRRWSPRRAVRADADPEALERLVEHVASLEVSLDALDDRMNGELEERDRRILRELHGEVARLESELAQSLGAAVEDWGRRIRRLVGWAVFVHAVVLGTLIALLLRAGR